MLRLVSKITVIKNINSQPNRKDPLGSILSPVLSNDFTIPSDCSELLDANVFTQIYESGKDVALEFNWVNNVEIDSSFKTLTKTAKVTFPRNLRFNGLQLMKGSSPVFGRGDRIIIELGYEWLNPKSNTYDVITSLKEQFRGYIVRVGIGTPLVLECEDQMFGLKQMRVKYPDTNDKVGKITLKNLLKRIFLLDINHNPRLTPNQDIFAFGMAENTATVKDANSIPIIVSTDTAPFTYSTINEKSVAEVLNDLRKKLGIYNYFDDFGNLRFELPFVNSGIITQFTPFYFEKQIIEEHNMKLQIEDEMAVKVVFKSKISDKKIGGERYGNDTYHLDSVTGKKVGNGFVGDALGDTITINAPNDYSQADCDKYAQQVLKANKYTGYAKGSTFETFGEPTVYVGGAVDLNSTLYPEKGGRFAVVGVRRIFGMRGYRQNIEVGIGLGNTLIS